MKSFFLYIVAINYIVLSVAFSVNTGMTAAETGAMITVSGSNAAFLSVSGGDASDTAELRSSLDSDLTPIFSLQVPERLDFTIDPWNLAGHGQIYSERFTIRNTGNAACVISLQDITCMASGGTVIVDSTQEIYAQDAAAVYLEINFESGEGLALSGKQNEYFATLLPGGEVAFWFTGAANEKTSDSWAGKGLSVSLKYTVSTLSAQAVE